MHLTTPKVTVTDVDRVLQLKSWWAMVAVLPLVRPLTVLVVNHTRISANEITIAATMLRFAAAGAFLLADREWLIAGALIFYFAYLLDCMDGAVARLRKQTSEFGRFLDHIGDIVGGLLCVIALSSGQNMLFTALVAAILLCHIIEPYLYYLTNTILSFYKADTFIKSGLRKSPMRIYLKYRNIFHSRNIKSFLSMADYEAITFFIFPIIGMPALGLKIGFCVLLMVTLYTVLSSFTAIHTGGNKFP